jgi:hypothetical protein
VLYTGLCAIGFSERSGRECATPWQQPAVELPPPSVEDYHKRCEALMVRFAAGKHSAQPLPAPNASSHGALHEELEQFCEVRTFRVNQLTLHTNCPSSRHLTGIVENRALWVSGAD